MGAGFHYFHGAGDDVANIERRVFQLYFARFDFGDIENVVDEIEETDAITLRDFDAAALFGGEGSRGQNVGHADYGIEGGADFVTHLREEVTFGAGGAFGFVAFDFEFGAEALDFVLFQFEVMRELLVDRKSVV